MNNAGRYLTSLAQALAKMSLYAEGHPARARASDASFEQLRELQREDATPVFSFLGREVIYNQRSMRELSDWDWSERLSSCGVQRLEFDGIVAREEYRAFLEEVLSRISLHGAGNIILPEGKHRATPIRFGAIGLKDTHIESQDVHDELDPEQTSSQIAASRRKQTPSSGCTEVKASRPCLSPKPSWWWDRCRRPCMGIAICCCPCSPSRTSISTPPRTR
ncbi:MAG: hypothetical protein U0163_11485 [Gemmatimonadaceae bacterium]